MKKSHPVPDRINDAVSAAFAGDLKRLITYYEQGTVNSAELGLAVLQSAINGYECLPDVKTCQPKTFMRWQTNEANKVMLDIAKVVLAGGLNICKDSRSMSPPMIHDLEDMMEAVKKIHPALHHYLIAMINGAAPHPDQETLDAEGIPFTIAKMQDHKANARFSEEQEARSGVEFYPDALRSDDVSPGLTLKSPLYLNGRAIEPQDELKK